MRDEYEASLCDGCREAPDQAEDDMNPFWKIVGCAALLGMLVFALSLLTMHAQTVSLSITGSSTGQNLHTLALAGDQLNASIFQGRNCSTWKIVAGGWA